MKLPALNDLLQYQNTKVIHYYCHHHPDLSFDQSQVIFKDLLSWMWLTQKRKQLRHHTFLFGPLIPLDAMWHAFILHTRDYMAFCEHYFACYFHHDMEPVGREYALTPEEFTAFLESCFEYLGEDWVARYFGLAYQA
ncbi:MAG: hypothetical protein WC785_02955 [Tatlockia sp.]